MANEKELVKDPNASTKNAGNNAQNKTASTQSAPSYDANTDYQQKINDAVAAGNYRDAAQYEQQRNAKIQGEGLNYEQTAKYADYLPSGNKYMSSILDNVDPNDTNSIYGAYRELISTPAQRSDLSDYINQLYDASLESAKAAVEKEYAGVEESLDLQKQEAEKNARANATQAAVNSQMAQKAWNEAQTAYGLSSGAQGQAALSRSNQLQSDITAIQTAQQAALAQIEQQRTTYKQQYEAAIREAAAQNDYQKAQALYQEAVRQDEALTSQQETLTQWAMQYLSSLGSAASTAALASYSGSGSGGNTGSAEYEPTDIKVIRELREMVQNGNRSDAENDYLWYASQNPNYANESVYNMIFGNGTTDYTGGYDEGNTANRTAGGSISKKPVQYLR